jgi:hypothetical protein
MIVNFHVYACRLAFCLILVTSSRYDLDMRPITSLRVALTWGVRGVVHDSNMLTTTNNMLTTTNE